MTDKEIPPKPPLMASDPQVFMDNLSKALETGAQIFNELSEANPQQDSMVSMEDMQKSFVDIATAYTNQPEKLLEKQMEFWQTQNQLWTSAWQKFLTPENSGEDESSNPPQTATEKILKDKRFKDESWHQTQVFEFLNQSYLAATNWAQSFVEEAGDLDEHSRKKAKFYAEQVTNALSPANFAFTNPEIIKLTLETNGENLVKGATQMAEDLKIGKIRQTDFSAYEVGRNMAMSPGKVIFQNDLIQLIQYEPSTPQVYQKPLLIVPPWINKFYILDLNEKKSFIKWAVAQGLTVFVISWVNPYTSLRHKRFEDYMSEGLLASLDVIENATGEKSVNAIGYCVGGTLLASTLGYMAQNKDKRITSATFFTTQVDFEDAGDLLVFVDEKQISEIEKAMVETGFMPGSVMATAFNMLRSNDLIWSYVVNNYLRGKQPMPFDLLCWNADSTNLTEANHSFYLRQCYLENNLSQGKMKLADTTIDLSKITVPVYNLAAREDHIAPLASVFKIGKLLGGKTRLVVSGSGHIAGVINPPTANKYQYWLNDSDAENSESWMENATEHQGSWWPDWKAWITAKSGKKIKARQPGDGKLKPLEDAPGSYVKIKGA